MTNRRKNGWTNKTVIHCINQWYSVSFSCCSLFSHSVMPDSLWPHGLQQARLPCPSRFPGACSNSCPLSFWQFHFPALEKEMATHSSVPAWRIPGMKEFGGLLSMGSHRVGHDWSDLAAATAAAAAAASNYLILYSPFLLLPSIFSSIRVFSIESALCIRWPKYWSFSFSISLSNE